MYRKIQSAGYSFIWRNKQVTQEGEKILLREEAILELFSVKKQALLLKTYFIGFTGSERLLDCNNWKKNILQQNKPWNGGDLPTFLKVTPKLVIKLSQTLYFNFTTKPKEYLKFLTTKPSNKPKIAKKSPAEAAESRVGNPCDQQL